MNYEPIARCMDNGHVIRFFFQKYPKNWRFGQLDQKSCGVFPVERSPHILSLCVPSSGFSINQPLFLKKTFFLRYFYLGCTELGIQPSCVRSPWLGEREDSIKVGVFSKKLFIKNDEILFYSRK